MAMTEQEYADRWEPRIRARFSDPDVPDGYLCLEQIESRDEARTAGQVGRWHSLLRAKVIGTILDARKIPEEQRRTLADKWQAEHAWPRSLQPGGGARGEDAQASR